MGYFHARAVVVIPHLLGQDCHQTRAPLHPQRLPKPGDSEKDSCGLASFGGSACLWPVVGCGDVQASMQTLDEIVRGWLERICDLMWPSCWVAEWAARVEVRSPVGISLD